VAQFIGTINYDFDGTKEESGYTCIIKIFRNKREEKNLYAINN